MGRHGATRQRTGGRPVLVGVLVTALVASLLGVSVWQGWVRVGPDEATTASAACDTPTPVRVATTAAMRAR